MLFLFLFHYYIRNCYIILWQQKPTTELISDLIGDKTHPCPATRHHSVSVLGRSNNYTTVNMLGDRAKHRFGANLPANKLSDFSIDHILNRAGESARQNTYFGPSSGLSDYTKNFILQGTAAVTNTSVALNWLQYSRYHPPKLQRKDLYVNSWSFFCDKI